MRRLLLFFAALAAFAWSQTAYAPPTTRGLVYKGTIKAAKTIFDVNDTNDLLSRTIKGYWAVVVIDVGDSKGYVVDSNAVIYDAKEKYYKVIPSSMYSDPCDPCHITLLYSDVSDEDGEALFEVVGKGKLTKYSNNYDVAKDFVPTRLKGAGFINNFDFFDPNYTYSGPVTVSLTLDSKWTRTANTNSYYVYSIINDIVAELTSKGEWTNWPHYPEAR